MLRNARSARLGPAKQWLAAVALAAHAGCARWLLGGLRLMRWLPWRSSGECMACCLSDVSACQPSLTWKDSESCGRGGISSVAACSVAQHRAVAAARGRHRYRRYRRHRLHPLFERKESYYMYVCPSNVLYHVICMYSLLCTWFQCCFQWAVCEILFSTWRVGIENMRFASLHSYLAYGNVIGAIPLAPKVTFFT